jgi:hypothetical protein
VKISHHPTGLTIIASADEDTGYKEGKLKCAYLSTPENIPQDSLVHKWIITPRYKLREEGDPVRHNDYVVLRNAQYKYLCLTSFPVKRMVVPGLAEAANTTFSDHMVGLCKLAAIHTKPGLNILLLRKAALRTEAEHLPAANKADTGKAAAGKAPKTAADTEELSERSAVFSSDYIRVVHREYRGHLIVRTDDEVELQSSVMPLGATTRKRGHRDLDQNLAVFLRAFADQQPREQLDFPAAYSSQGVWQVLATETSPDNVAVHGKLKFESCVRLRHVITGQYLSVRPLESEDTEKLKQYSTFCIPKQAAKELDPNVTPAHLNRGRSRHAHSREDAALPSALLESASPVRRQSIADDSLLPPLPQPTTVKLCIVSVRADDLHSSDWTGKHRNSVQLTFPSAGGKWELKSKRSATAGNTAYWEFDKLNYGAHLSVTEADISAEQLDVSVYRENVVSGRTLIGHGVVSFPQMLFQYDDEEALDMTVALTDPATAQPAGLVIVRVLVNALLTKEEARTLAQNMRGRTGLMGLIGGIGGLNGPSKSAAEVERAMQELEAGPEQPAESEDDTDEANKDNRLDEIMDGGFGISASDVHSTNWVVASSTNPDKYTKFNILVVDKSSAVDDDAVAYNERFVFEHAYTRQRLKLSTLLGMDSQTTWWEYTGDVSLVPDPFKEGSIIDSEVCQFEKVDDAEIRDIMYGCRFLQLARAATTALQLTPRSSQLYMPLFRHFHNSLQSLTLWTLGAVNSDATLCAESTVAPDTKKYGKDSRAMKTLADKLGIASEKFLAAVSSDRLVQGVQGGLQGGLAMLGIEGEGTKPGAAAEAAESDVDSDDDDLFGGGGGIGEEYDDEDTDEEEYEDEDEDEVLDDPDGGWSNPLGLQMNILGSGSKYRALERVGKRVSKRKKAAQEAAAAAAAALAAAEAAKPPRLPSLAPWIGRMVPRLEKKSSGRQQTPVPAAPTEVEETSLQKYATAKLNEFVFKDLAVNEVLLRRQIILSDMMFVDQIVHFLNVLFQLQRAASLTHDARMQEQFPEVPPLLLACSVQINKLIRACVYKNEKVALKLISVQGSFLAMISQKIQGWEPPIEAILLQTCKEDTSSSTAYGCVGSMNSQNDSLLGSSMNNPDAALSQEGDEDGELFEAPPTNTFSIEPILTDAISASDIRQVVEQMHELHLKRDPSALKIIGLLTLLCSSGRAKKYFQNLLINALAIQDLEDYSLTGDFVQQIRPSSLQTNCMLFFTQYENRRWEVKFNSAFSFPAQQSKNQEQLRHKLEREGDSLKKLFAYYNTDDNAVLDVMESFELLEDLGLGGPFLYKEVRHCDTSLLLILPLFIFVVMVGYRSGTWRAPRSGASPAGGATAVASTTRRPPSLSASCRPSRPSR